MASGGTFTTRKSTRGDKKTTHLRLLYRPRIYTAQYAITVLKHWDTAMSTFDGSA